MAFSFSPKVVTDGLVLALDAANPRSYPGSGTSWRDLTANNYIGSLINGPTFSSANGGALVFDGVDDYYQTTIPAYSIITVNIWFYPISGTGLFLYGDSPSFPITLIDYDASGNIRIYIYNNYQTFSSVVTLNRWNLITLVLDSSSKFLYVNGNFVGSGGYGGIAGQTGIVRLGVQNLIGYGNSRIASAQIYNRAPVSYTHLTLPTKA